MEKKESSNMRKTMMMRWALVGAVVIVFIAAALSYIETPPHLNFPLFFKDPKSCHCPQVLSMILFWVFFSFMFLVNGFYLFLSFVGGRFMTMLEVLCSDFGSLGRNI